MGITGLLPFLKKIQRDVHLSSFRGRKVAVDAYSWLHKGSYACALQLVTKSDKVESLPFVKYCVRRVNLLKQHDIQPIMVFDGGYLPTKAATEKERRQRRETFRQKGKALLRDGKKSEAVDCFQKCVDVTPEMALAVIKECRAMHVECIVAPYEADAQLAYLEKVSIVDLVITEDSDLLAFGCRRVLFKLDECGNGKLVELQEIGKANDTLVGFNPDSFRQMCILSGCDYLPSVPGVGLARASKLMKKFNQDPYRVIKSLQFETGKVPEGYEEAFRRAELTFLYQMVFDPRTQRQVRLNEPPADLDLQNLEFAGVESSPHKAVGMARGNLNPLTQEVMDTYSPSKAPPPKSTGWNASAMGISKKPYPVAGQVSMVNFISSAKSKASFKPPKKVQVEDQSLNDDELQALYGSPRDRGNLDESGEGDTEQTTSRPNVITVSRYFAKPSTSTSTLASRPSLFSKRSSCPETSRDSEMPTCSALQMLDLTSCTSSQSTVLTSDQEPDKGKESVSSVPESPAGPRSTSPQSLPDPSPLAHTLPGISAKKRLSFVLRESHDKSHDTSHDTSHDKSHVFAKRPKVAIAPDSEMGESSGKEEAENTDPDDQYYANQDGSQEHAEYSDLVEKDTDQNSPDEMHTSALSLPIDGAPMCSASCADDDTVAAEQPGDLSQSRYFLQSSDMMFSRAAVSTVGEMPMETDKLVDLTNENSPCLMKDVPTHTIPKRSGSENKQLGGVRIGLSKGRTKSKFNPPKAASSGLKQSTFSELAKFQYTRKPSRMSI